MSNNYFNNTFSISFHLSSFWLADSLCIVISVPFLHSSPYWVSLKFFDGMHAVTYMCACFVFPAWDGCATLRVVCMLNVVVLVTEFVGNGLWLVELWTMIVWHLIGWWHLLQWPLYVCMFIHDLLSLPWAELYLNYIVKCVLFCMTHINNNSWIQCS